MQCHNKNFTLGSILSPHPMVWFIIYIQYVFVFNPIPVGLHLLKIYDVIPKDTILQCNQLNFTLGSSLSPHPKRQLSIYIHYFVFIFIPEGFPFLIKRKYAFFFKNKPQPWRPFCTSSLEAIPHLPYLLCN
jgi:hypothetical protein